MNANPFTGIIWGCVFISLACLAIVAGVWVATH